MDVSPSSRTLIAATLVGVLTSAVPAAAKDRYVAFGDSVTEATEFDSYECDCAEAGSCGYPYRLQRDLKGIGWDVALQNWGHGGERTPEGLTRIDEALNAVVDGKVLLLMEGTNDISRPDLVSPEDTLFNLTEMARKAEEKGYSVVHMTLIPRYPNAKIDAKNALNALMAQRIRNLAASHGRPYADPFYTFFTKPDLFFSYYSDCELGDPVGHPNPKGFDLLETTIFRALVGIDEVPPQVAELDPADGAVDVSPFATIRVRLADAGGGVDLSDTHLFVNGAEVAFTSTGDAHLVDLLYTPPDGLGGTVSVRVRASDVAGNVFEGQVSRYTVDPTAPGPCAPGPTVLCIDDKPGDRRFKVTLGWHTAANGGREGDAIPLQLEALGLRRGGLFSFFSADNPEALVKVLNGCSITGTFWVFESPTTNLGFELRIIDTVAAIQGASIGDYEWIVTNKDGTIAKAVSDFEAFETCGYGALP